MRHLRAVLALASVTATLGVVGPAAAPAFAAPQTCDKVNELVVENADPSESESQPAAALQVREAQDLLGGPRSAGSGVTVAVLDSAARPAAGQDLVAQGPVYTSTPNYDGLWHSGSVTAGLVNGPRRGENQVVGIAPGAQVVNIPVYEAEASTAEGSDDLVELGTANVAAGLGRALATGASIVVVPFVVDKTPALTKAVRDLTSRGRIVVAAAGDKPAENAPFFEDFGTPRSGDDAAQEGFPAGFAADDDLVVVATSTVPDGIDPRSVLLPNSLTTVAVPTAGAVSYGPNQLTCDLPNPSSRWAAAEVGGILALLEQRFPRDNARQLIARLTATAAGAPGDEPGVPNRFLGNGIVQLMQALTRQLDPDPQGNLTELVPPNDPAEPAIIDPPDPDLLDSMREDALWWGVGAGGVIAVLLLLRPVIGRRRRTTRLR